VKNLLHVYGDAFAKYGFSYVTVTEGWMFSLLCKKGGRPRGNGFKYSTMSPLGGGLGRASGGPFPIPGRVSYT